MRQPLSGCCFSLSPQCFQLFDHQEPYPLGEVSNHASLQAVSVGRLDGVEVADLHRNRSPSLQDQASRREDAVEAVGHHGLDRQLIFDCHPKGPVVKITDLACPGSTSLRIEEEFSATLQGFLNSLAHTLQGSGLAAVGEKEPPELQGGPYDRYAEHVSPRRTAEAGLQREHHDGVQE